jgi:hypothetical protein
MIWNKWLSSGSDQAAYTRACCVLLHASAPRICNTTCIIKVGSGAVIDWYDLFGVDYWTTVYDMHAYLIRWTHFSASKLVKWCTGADLLLDDYVCVCVCIHQFMCKLLGDTPFALPVIYASPSCYLKTCRFVLREKYCWLVAGGWFVLGEKYCWLVADKPSEQGAWRRNRLELQQRTWRTN